jgi:hypothetical protein
MLVIVWAQPSAMSSPWSSVCYSATRRLRRPQRRTQRRRIPPRRLHLPHLNTFVPARPLPSRTRSVQSRPPPLRISTTGTTKHVLGVRCAGCWVTAASGSCARR